MYMYHYRQGYSKLSTGQRLWCPCTIYIYIYIYACIITDKGTATCQRDSDSGAHVQLPALQLRRMRSRRNRRGVKVVFFLPSQPLPLYFSLFFVLSLPLSRIHLSLSPPSPPSLPPSFALCVYFTACRAHLGVELGAARRTFQC